VTEGPIATELGSPPTTAVPADTYSGPRAPLRPIYEKGLLAHREFGPFETVPKMGYGSP
jgi:hypothetical protein